MDDLKKPPDQPENKPANVPDTTIKKSDEPMLREYVRQYGQAPPPESVKARLTKRLASNASDSYINDEFFLALGIIFLVLAFLLDTPRQIWEGSLTILTSPAVLLTDYIELGGMGAAFLNVGMMILASLLLIRKHRVLMTGPLIAAVFTVAGFSFFGKNIYNSIPIALGVFCFAKLTRQPCNRFLVHALFASALGPLVSLLTFDLPLPLLPRILLGFATGLFTGFVIPPLAAHFLNFHQGYNLYNIGFTAGIIGTFFIAVLRALGISVEPVAILSGGNNLFFGVFLGLLFLAILIWGMILSRGKLAGYLQLLKLKGRLATDFPKINGIGLTLTNMGLLGLVSLAYVLLIGGELNGPVIGGIFTVVGFAAYGKHIRNVLPIFGGVLIANLLNIYDPHSTSALLATLFGTTLAPIAGRFGPVNGALAGMLHMALVMNVSYLHGGVNLYNNGFAGGFIAAAFVPLAEAVILVFQARRKPKL
ncbi:MAG: DUF1576 domain-containing protein [Saccharofermentanales bacterium]